MTGGKRAAPPTGKGVPAWLRRVLDRGLSLEPSERYPTTEALLAALAADPTRRRWALALAGAAALAVAGGFGVQGYREAQQVAACEAEGASVAEVWNEDVRARLRAGVVATGVAYAEKTAESVMPYFSTQAEAWRQARAEACLNTRVRGEWDEDTYTRAVWCLDERRMDLEALVAELSRADPAALEEAVGAAAALSPIEPCRDAAHLARMIPLPDDRERVRAVQQALSRAGALAMAGRHEAGEDAAREALAAAEGIGWAPLAVEAEVLHGQVLASSGAYAEAETELERAFFRAAKIGALEVAASAAVELTSVVGIEQARHAEGLRWSRHADVAFTALGVDERSLWRTEALSTVAALYTAAGAHEEARALFERVLAIREAALAAGGP